MEKTGWKDPLKELPEPYQDVLILVGDRSVINRGNLWWGMKIDQSVPGEVLICVDEHLL